MNIFQKIINKIKNIKSKAQTKLTEIKNKALAFIVENKTTIQGFIKLATFLYATYSGKEKMENVIKMVTASVTGTEYSDKDADAVANQIEDKIQEVYEEMKANNLV